MSVKPNVPNEKLSCARYMIEALKLLFSVWKYLTIWTIGLIFLAIIVLGILYGIHEATNLFVERTDLIIFSYILFLGMMFNMYLASVNLTVFKIPVTESYCDVFMAILVSIFLAASLEVFPILMPCCFTEHSSDLWIGNIIFLFIFFMTMFFAMKFSSRFLSDKQ